jgi:hypothetical protein
MRGTGEAGSLHSRIQNRKGRASALRIRGKGLKMSPAAFMAL